MLPFCSTLVFCLLRVVVGVAAAFSAVGFAVFVVVVVVAVRLPFLAANVLLLSADVAGDIVIVC